MLLLRLTPLMLVVPLCGWAQTAYEPKESLAHSYYRELAPEATLREFKSEVLRRTPTELRLPVSQMLDFVYDENTVARATRVAVDETYNEEELRALLGFYSSPIGKQILRKQGKFLAMMHLHVSEVASAKQMPNQQGLEEALRRALEPAPQRPKQPSSTKQ